jgi:Flp pilus assembly protein TadG
MATRLGSWIGRALLPGRWRGLARNERGATLVEFGLLAPFFFGIVGAILETSVVFLSGQILDSAVQDVGRLIRTGQAQGTIVSDTDFREKVCARLYGLFPNCDAKLFVDVQTIANFDSASISAPVNWNCTDLTAEECTAWTRDPAYTAGAGSSIMLVQVYYKWPIILNMFDVSMSNLPTGERLLGAATVFRNEPFS